MITYDGATNLSELPAASGTYALLLTADAPTTLSVGRLGIVSFPPGLYAYLGSAHGPGGLKARIGRHLRAGKPLHWHIDYLTAALRVTHVLAATSEGAQECDWVRRLLEMKGASVPASGFGNTDCRSHCPAHLVLLPKDTDIARLESLLVQARLVHHNAHETLDRLGLLETVIITT